MIETIAMAAVGLAFVVFLGVLFFGACYAIFRATRRPATPPVAVSRSALNPEDANLDFLRRKFPDPVTAPMPDLEDLHLTYDLKREREDKVADIRKRLDAQRTPAPAPPNA